MNVILSICLSILKPTVMLFISIALVYTSSGFAQSHGGVSTNIVAWYQSDLGMSPTGWTDQTNGR